MNESDILYQNKEFWVCKAVDERKGFEVYEDGITHSTRRAIIGYTGAPGLEKAKSFCDRFASETAV